MDRPNAHARRHLLISLSPLTDVILILLIFFMISGKLVETDPFEIAPPRSASETETDIQDILVLVTEDGRLALDGRRIESSRLRSVVTDRLSTDRSVLVRLKADSQAPATQVITVMEILQEAGVEKLKLLTIPAGN